jgi:MFS family permease
MIENTHPRFFYGYLIIVASFFIMLLSMGIPGTFGLLLKPISDDFGWSRAATSGAYSLSMIIGGLIGILVGRLTDRFGPRFVITFSGLLNGAGYLLLSRMNNLWELYIYFGIIVGAGMVVNVPLLSTVARWFVKKRSMMNGFVLTGASFGGIIMPLLINWILQSHGWRVTCFVSGMAILVVVVSCAQLLKRDPGKIGLAAHGASEDNLEVTSPETGVLTLKEGMRTRQFWLYLAIFGISAFYVMPLQVHIVPYATDVGIAPTAAAVILTIIGAAIFFGHIVLGHAGDKFGYKRMFIIGTIITVLAVLVLTQARELWTFYLFAVVLGLAFGCCDSQESSLVAWVFGLRSHGLFLGFSIFSFCLGGAIGMVATGYIYDVTHGYQLAFIIFAVLSFIATILTLFLKPAALKSPSAVK